MNSRGVVEGEMGAILKGPHIKRLVFGIYSDGYIIEVEPLHFPRVVEPAVRGNKCRIARVPS